MADWGKMFNSSTFDSFKTQDGAGTSQWDWRKVGKFIAPALLALGGNEHAYRGYYQGLNAVEEQKRQLEEEQRRKEWEDFQRKVAKEEYERNIVQVTPEMEKKYKETPFGFMFAPTGEQGISNPTTETIGEDLRTQAKLSGIDLPETYTNPNATFEPTYGNVTKQDILEAEKYLPKEMSEEDKLDLLLKRKQLQNYDSLIGNRGAKGEGDKETDDYKKVNLLFNMWKAQFGGKQNPITGEYEMPPGKTQQDFIKWADKQGVGDTLIRPYFGLPAYQAPEHPIEPSPIAGVNRAQILSDPNIEIPSNKPTQSNPIIADAQKAVRTHGSPDKAIEYYKKQGLSDNNPLIKALQDMKKKKHPKDLLASNGAKG